MLWCIVLGHIARLLTVFYLFQCFKLLRMHVTTAVLITTLHRLSDGRTLDILRRIFDYWRPFYICFMNAMTTLGKRQAYFYSYSSVQSTIFFFILNLLFSRLLILSSSAVVHRRNTRSPWSDFVCCSHNYNLEADSWPRHSRSNHALKFGGKLIRIIFVS